MDREKLLELKKAVDRHISTSVPKGHKLVHGHFTVDANALPEIIDLALKGLDEWEPTHRNKRTGAICQLVREDIANERVTEFDDMAVIYMGADGTKYVTSYDDFFDGSFEALPTPPKEGGVK